MKHRILVVEDNTLNRELLCDWLEAEGYGVEAAAGLTAACDAVARRAPDAVLLDVQLGTEDGLALASWMRQQEALRHIPIIVVTAHAIIAERPRILEAGCNAYVAKPVDFNLLRDHLRRWLAPPSALRA